MADAGRQSFTDKVGAALKPDSQKTTTEHVGDAVSGKADNVAGAVEPEGDKSFLQKVSETFTGHGHSHGNK